MREKYFSASRDMEAYAKYSNRDPGNYLPAMAELMEEIINQAYRVGYADALKDIQKENKAE